MFLLYCCVLEGDVSIYFHLKVCTFENECHKSRNEHSDCGFRMQQKLLPVLECFARPTGVAGGTGRGTQSPKLSWLRQYEKQQENLS